MLLQPFKEIIEPPTPTIDDWYIGTVLNNEDPLLLKRLKIRTAMYDELAEDEIPWAFPIPNCFLGTSKNSEDFAVPEVGSQVRVFFPTHDPDSPFYMGAEKGEYNRCSFFDEDYPNTYGKKDSVGNFIKVNKAKKTIHMQHCSGTNVQINEHGGIELTMAKNGGNFRMDPDGSFTLVQGEGVIQIKGESNGTLIAECADIALAAKSINLESDKVHINGDISTSTGASTEVQVGPNYLTFTGGILTRVE